LAFACTKAEATPATHTPNLWFCPWIDVSGYTHVNHINHVFLIFFTEFGTACFLHPNVAIMTT